MNTQQLHIQLILSLSSFKKHVELEDQTGETKVHYPGLDLANLG